MNQATPAPRKRLYYFDMLKGLAIFMVVMGHVLTMCIRQVDSAVAFKLIGEIHMPLFFFISGWFTFRTDSTGGISVPKLWQRAKQLIVPMVVVSSLWIWRFPNTGLESPLNSTFAGLWGDEWKNGYWFTLVLMEVILLYVASIPVLKLCRNAWSACLASAVIWVALLVAANYIPAGIKGYTSFGLTVQFYAAFMAGAIARRHKVGFDRLTANGTMVTVALLCAAALIYYVCWYWEFPAIPQWCITPARGLMHIAIAIVAIAVVKPWSEEAFAPEALPGSHKLARMWSYIGTQSLAIYLLHYFFLFPLGFVRPTLVSMGLGFTPLIGISAAVAALIVAVTLGANIIISRSPLLAWLLTGKVK